MIDQVIEKFHRQRARIRVRVLAQNASVARKQYSAGPIGRAACLTVNAWRGPPLLACEADRRKSQQGYPQKQWISAAGQRVVREAGPENFFELTRNCSKSI